MPVTVTLTVTVTAVSLRHGHWLLDSHCATVTLRLSHAGGGLMVAGSDWQIIDPNILQEPIRIWEVPLSDW